MGIKRSVFIRVNCLIILLNFTIQAEDPDEVLYKSIIKDGQTFFKDSKAETRVEGIDLLKRFLRREQFDSLEARLRWYETEAPPRVDGAAQLQGVYDKIKLKGGDQAYLDTWCEKRPNSAFAFLTRGCFYLDQAWKARGGGFASGVSKDQFKLFKARMKKAGKDLKKALELDPQIGTIYRKIIYWAGCGGSTVGEAEKYFRAAMKVVPNDTYVINMMRFVYTPQWHGSVEKQLEFARIEAKKSPSLGFLIGYAHEAVANVAGGYGKRRLEFFNYYKKPGVWDEIFTSYKIVLKAHPTSKRRIVQIFRYAVYADRVDELFVWLNKENLL